MVGSINQIFAELHEKNLREWTLALRIAEQAAARDPKAVLRSYQVNYRVGGSASVTKGTSDERRAAVIQLLRSINELEHHSSTSTWVIKLYIPAASTLVRLLGAPLERRWDFLNVVEITSNRDQLGDAKLQS